MVTVRLKSFITLLSKQWKRKQKTTVRVEQKIPVVVKIASVNVHVAKAENVLVKENAHAAANANKKEKANNQYPERYQLLTFMKILYGIIGTIQVLVISISPGN